MPLITTPGMRAVFSNDVGPCAEPCAHVICARDRELVASPCLECGRPIGYEVAFYFRHGEPAPGALLGELRGLVHAGCLVGFGIFTEDELQRSRDLAKQRG